MGKYELTEKAKTITHYGKEITLYQIKALRDIPSHRVSKGDIGGWIENEANLSQNGDCWIGINGHAYDEAQVLENAYVGSGDVYDTAIVKGYSKILNQSKVYGISTCIIEGKSIVSSSTIVDSHIVGTTNIKESQITNLIIELEDDDEEYIFPTVRLYKVEFEALKLGHLSAHAEWSHCMLYGDTLAFYEKSNMKNVLWDKVKRVSVRQPLWMEYVRLEEKSRLVLKPLVEKDYEIVLKGYGDENYILIDGRISLSNTSIVGAVELFGSWTLVSTSLSDYAKLIGTKKFRTKVNHGNVSEFSSVIIDDKDLLEVEPLEELVLSGETIRYVS